MQITFQNPEFLLFLSAIPMFIVFHILSLKYVKTKALLFANFEALQRALSVTSTKLPGKPKISNNISLLLFRILTFTLLVLALSGMTLWFEGKSTNQSFMLNIDSSSSMLAGDIVPSRFQAAKNAALSFVDNAPENTKIGIISFSGTVFLIQPLTSDKFDLKQKIENLKIQMFSGTDIAKAIIESTNNLINTNTSRTIIIITDGRHTQPTSIDEALNYAKKNNVKIHAFGIGTVAGGKISNSNLITSLDEELLKKITFETNGLYIHVTSAEDLKNGLLKILDLQKSLVPYNISNYLLFISLFLLFMEWGLINTKFRNMP